MPYKQSGPIDENLEQLLARFTARLPCLQCLLLCQLPVLRVIWSELHVIVFWRGGEMEQTSTILGGEGCKVGPPLNQLFVCIVAITVEAI